MKTIKRALQQAFANYQIKLIGSGLPDQLSNQQQKQIAQAITNAKLVRCVKKNY